MRRNEFKINDKSSIDEILNSCEYGTLSLIDNSSPYSVALNFVYFENSIYFHGSGEGKKIDIIKKNNQASFLVVKPYSTIPSYFFDTLAACPATQFFASVFMQGDLHFINDCDKKANILNALMQKLQKDGGYEKIAYDKNMYKKILENVVVIEFKIEDLSCKIKVGQNLNSEKREKVLQKLKSRNNDIDKQTINKIKFYN